MAQRAYRQRKDSTLEELRKRVSELTKIIEVMNNTFNTCSDRLYASNLSQDQMLDINEVSTLYEKLVAEARNPSEHRTLTDHLNAPNSSNRLQRR